ncbi:hypothetical protein [Dryocola sp. BD586]|jgi:hypothetical protein|uniref:hypothetical protein n=1 Tax=Dryocola sp. BD586 TaxID=3133271 RepID=UPI003F505F0B
MSKKSTTRKNGKKVVRSAAPAAATASAEAELSYDEMLSELEAIVSEADVRLAEEEAVL